MGKLLLIVVAVALALALASILIAPDYDLDPTVTPQGKQLAALFVLAIGAVTTLLSRRPLLQPAVAAGWGGEMPEPPLLDLTCTRVC